MDSKRTEEELLEELTSLRRTPGEETTITIQLPLSNDES